MITHLRDATGAHQCKRHRRHHTPTSHGTPSSQSCTPRHEKGRKKTGVHGKPPCLSKTVYSSTACPNWVLSKIKGLEPLGLQPVFATAWHGTIQRHLRGPKTPPSDTYLAPWRVSATQATGSGLCHSDDKSNGPWVLTCPNPHNEQTKTRIPGLMKCEAQSALSVTSKN